MANKSKTYTILILVIIGLVFLGIGCTGKGPSPAVNTSATGAPAENATAAGTSSSPTAGGAESIKLMGSDTMLPLALAEAEEYMKENPGKSLSVTGGGSGVGINQLIDGNTNIADASREVTNDEIQKAKAKGVNITQNLVGYDGITVIVNSANPVSNLTFTQLRGIYNGSITNWKDVGGQDKPIVAYSRETTSGTYADFKKDVLLGDEYGNGVSPQSATGLIVDNVANNVNAIGYIGFAYLDNSVKALSLDKGNGSVSPTPETILSGAYPLSRNLYMDTNGEPSGLTKEFIDFVLSDKGQSVASENKYIPLKK